MADSTSLEIAGGRCAKPRVRCREEADITVLGSRRPLQRLAALVGRPQGKLTVICDRARHGFLFALAPATFR